MIQIDVLVGTVGTKESKALLNTSVTDGDGAYAIGYEKEGDERGVLVSGGGLYRYRPLIHVLGSDAEASNTGNDVIVTVTTIIVTVTQQSLPPVRL